MTDTSTEAFDPSAHTVAETQEYLATADATERDRVVALEREGHNRKGIVEFVPSPEDVPADEDGYTRVPVPDAYVPGEPVPVEDDTDEV